MSKNSEALNRDLYQLLRSRGYKPKMLSTSGQSTPVPEEAAVFQFDFIKDGEDYGKVSITIDGDKKLIVYYNDDVANSPDTNTSGTEYPDSWSAFVRMLSSWRFRNGLRKFDLENEDHLESDMARREHMRKQEQIAEGYYPMGKKASYSDAIPTVKMVIQHSRQIEEGEQRYRNVARIFLENQDGERFLAPTTKPGIAKVYARHIAEGGKPHDERWNHIGSICEEYQKMAGFVRATRGHQFNESAQQLVESGIAHYNSLRESLSKMTGHRGYNMYFESWTPPLMEDDSDVDSINELFVQETLDPRIESVMPILSKLQKQVSEMTEVSELSEWADSLVEGGDGGEASEETDVDTASDAGEPGGEDAPEDDLMEAPGAETLAHNERTSKSNLDAFDLDEGGQQWPDTSNSLAKRKPVAAFNNVGVKAGRPGGMTVATRVDPTITSTKVTRKDDDRPIPSFLKKTVDEGDGGQEALNSVGIPEGYGDFGEEYEDMADRELIRHARMLSLGKYVEQDEHGDLLNRREIIRLLQSQAHDEDLEEDLDANQKRVGQLGPTEKVGPKGAVGKLVGACENFINTDAQAVVTEDDPEDIKEGQEDLDAILRIIRK